MPNYVDDIQSIRQLIRVMNSSVEFYKDVVNNTGDKHLIDALTSVLIVKNITIENLQKLIIIEDHERENDDDFLVNMSKKYAFIISKIKNDQDHTLITHLEEVEDKILKKTRDAIAANNQLDVIKVLEDSYLKMQVSHNKLLSLQHAAA